MTNTNEDLGRQIELLVAKHVAATRKAVQRALAASGVAPVVAAIDEAHLLSDQFLLDLGGFLNFAFDSRDLLTAWLVGQSALRKNLGMQQHLALAMRVSAQVHFEPVTDRETFTAIISGCLGIVGGKSKLFGDPALELLFRSSRGVLRVAAKLLRASLRLAHEKDQSFVGEHIMEQAIEQMFVIASTGSSSK